MSIVDDVVAELNSNIDEKFREFTSKLLPSNSNILGVRLPVLRKMARQIAKGQYWMDFLECDQVDLYEFVMLQGMVVGYIKADIEVIIALIKRFVPKNDNWSVCDSFCSELKVTRNNYDIMFELINNYACSDNEFEARFAIVMLIFYYINDTYYSDVIKILDSVYNEKYYVKMAVAWAVSICYIKYPSRTLCYIKQNNLDDFTYNKSLQKIIESRAVDNAARNLMRELKR